MILDFFSKNLFFYLILYFNRFIKYVKTIKTCYIKTPCDYENKFNSTCFCYHYKNLDDYIYICSKKIYVFLDNVFNCFHLFFLMISANL